MNRTTKGALIALSVAALFSARSTVAGANQHDTEKNAKKEAKVHCTGVNECKGKGECAAAGNSCGGKNECKGKGMTMTSEDECKQKGGKVTN